MGPRSRLDPRAPSASSGENSSTAGMLAARAWLSARGVLSAGLSRWHADILLDVVDHPAREPFDDRIDTRFRIEIYAEEWGFFFCHAGLASWIRVTDIRFGHGRDDYGLLAGTPALKAIDRLLRSVDPRHALRFRRSIPRVLT